MAQLSRRSTNLRGSTRARVDGWNTRHDRGMEGGVPRSPERRVLRLPSQHGDLSRYAWLYRLRPASFKWAAMAAIASHPRPAGALSAPAGHQRRGLRGSAAQSSRRQRLLATDVNTIRQTNNAIFDDIFWAHLAYTTADDGESNSSGCSWTRSATTRRCRGLRGDRSWPSHHRRRIVVTRCSTGSRRAHLVRQCAAPRTRTARPGTAPLRPSFLCVRQDRFARRIHEFRGHGIRGEAASFTLFSLFIPHLGISHAVGRMGGRDHALRPPMALVRRASFHASESSMPTPRCSVTACAASPTMPAHSPRCPASSRRDPVDPTPRLGRLGGSCSVVPRLDRLDGVAERRSQVALADDDERGPERLSLVMHSPFAKGFTTATFGMSRH